MKISFNFIVYQRIYCKKIYKFFISNLDKDLLMEYINYTDILYRYTNRCIIIISYTYTLFIPKIYQKVYIQLLEFFLYMIIIIIIEHVNIEYVSVFVTNLQKIIVFLFLYGNLY